MLKNYLLITLRNLRKYKIYSFINILGFSIALVPVVLALLYVAYELSYDRYNLKSDRFYRVVNDGQDFFGRKIIDPVMPNSMTEAMKDEFPEVEFSARMLIDRGVISCNEKEFDEKRILVTDPDFLKIFTFEFIKGDPATSLNDPNSVCLSESTARRYFGTKNPMGKTLLFRYAYDVIVKGVYKDLPSNSHFAADLIIPASLISGNCGIASTSGISNPSQSWGMSMYHVYFLLRENASVSEVDKKYEALLNKHGMKNPFITSHYFSQPVKDIHLKSDIYSRSGETQMDNIYLYLTLAFIILIIASINYVNLTTARFSQRVKEISIRKIIGAERGQLLRQLIIETFVLTFVSLIITIFLVILILPYFNNYVERDIHLSLNLFSGIFGLIILISICAGLYPSIVVSSVSPLSFFRGRIISLRSSRFRNILIIMQFVFTIVFVFCSISVKNQLTYMTKKDLGFRKDNIVNITLKGNYTESKLKALKNEITKYPGIIKASASNCLPVFIPRAIRISLPGRPENKKFIFWNGAIDKDFIDLYEMKIINGRSFINNYPSDEKNAIVINETAVKDLGWKDPVGKTLAFPVRGGNVNKHVIGVLKDFHNMRVSKKIEPLYFNIDSTESKSQMSIKLTSENILEKMKYIQSVMKVFQPAYPFDFKFLEEEINLSNESSYKTEFRLLNIFTIFSFFTLLISCLGLYGLVSFTTELRNKEIGIRKVLGATVLQIGGLFVKEMMQLIIISSIIATPIAYYIMNKWLSDFPYRIELNLWILMAATVSVLVIAIISMSFQVVKAAIQNPVKSLKYE